MRAPIRPPRHSRAAPRTTGTAPGLATPVITWANPADLTYGTALSGTQLNATVAGSVAGTLAYTPPAGTVLGAGAAQTLSVKFTPTDPAAYATVTKTVQINVAKATPTVTVTGGSFTYDGSAHPATATATGLGGAAVSGTFSITYTPGGTTAPAAGGTYGATATFTSTNTN